MPCWWDIGLCARALWRCEVSIRERLLAVLDRYVVGPEQRPPDSLGPVLIDELERAAVEPLVDACGDIDCCCRCCDEHRDALTLLAGGQVPRVRKSAFHAAPVDS